MAKTSISAIVLTHESERTLDQVLTSLAWCDEIVVVDSHSQDRSLEIARKHGAKILNRAFDGYSPQKQFGIDQGKHDWAFIIDSDEVVTDELRVEIQALLAPGAPPPPHAGYQLYSQMVFLGQAMRFSGTYVVPLRLFDRRRGKLNGALVHEVVEVQGSVGQLQNRILHYSYLTLEDYFAKFNKYTSFAALDLAKNRRKFSKLTVWTSFPVHFIKRYFLQLGILDGYAGFLWCLFSALYPTVKYAKLAELQRASASSKL